MITTGIIYMSTGTCHHKHLRLLASVVVVLALTRDDVVRTKMMLRSNIAVPKHQVLGT